jgi:hypothetical protein
MAGKWQWDDQKDKQRGRGKKEGKQSKQERTLTENSKRDW